MAKNPPARPVDPTAITPGQLARLLAVASGKKVLARDVSEAIKAGAPVGQGKRINLVELMAWLEREIAPKR